MTSWHRSKNRAIHPTKPIEKHLTTSEDTVPSHNKQVRWWDKAFFHKKTCDTLSRQATLISLIPLRIKNKYINKQGTQKKTTRKTGHQKKTTHKTGYPSFSTPQFWKCSNNSIQVAGRCFGFDPTSGSSHGGEKTTYLDVPLEVRING